MNDIELCSSDVRSNDLNFTLIQNDSDGFLYARSYILVNGILKLIKGFKLQIQFNLTPEIELQISVASISENEWQVK